MKTLSKKIKSVWGISEVGFSIMATMETSFLVFFLTDVAKLPLGIVGVITGSTALIDAISAIIAGIVIDKVNLKGGKYRPWLIICPPIVTVFFVVLFTKIGGNTTAAFFIMLGYVLSHFIWNIAWTANRNLIPVLTDDHNERAFLSSRISAGSSTGKIIASYLVPALSGVLIASLSGVTAYTVTALVVAILFLICYFIHYFITKGYDNEPVSERKAVTFKDMGRAIVGNGNLIALLIHDAIRLIAYYGVAATAAYYSKVVLETPSFTSWLLIMFYLGTTVGSLFSTRAAKKFGSKKTSAIGCLLSAICLGIAYLLPGSKAQVLIMMFLAQLTFGVAYGLTANLYSMCGTYSEWKTGGNARGIIMAFCSLAIKIAIAVRGVLITAVLGWIAYDPDMTVMTALAKSRIKFLFAGVFAIVMLVSLIPLIFFRLDDKKVEEMDAEIAARKHAEN